MPKMGRTQKKGRWKPGTAAPEPRLLLQSLQRMEGSSVVNETGGGGGEDVADEAAGAGLAAPVCVGSLTPMEAHHAPSHDGNKGPRSRSWVGSEVGLP